MYNKEKKNQEEVRAYDAFSKNITFSTGGYWFMPKNVRYGDKICQLSISYLEKMETFGSGRGLVDLVDLRKKEQEEKIEEQMRKALKKMPWEIKKIQIILSFWKWWKRRF